MLPLGGRPSFSWMVVLDIAFQPRKPQSTKKKPNPHPKLCTESWQLKQGQTDVEQNLIILILFTLSLHLCWQYSFPVYFTMTGRIQIPFKWKYEEARDGLLWVIAGDLTATFWWKILPRCRKLAVFFLLCQLVFLLISQVAAKLCFPLNPLFGASPLTLVNALVLRGNFLKQMELLYAKI